MSNPESKTYGEIRPERIVFFSDAVFAIAITILILDLKLPDIPKDFQNAIFLKLYQPIINKFLSFLLSFVVIAIFWYGHLIFTDFLDYCDNNLIFLNLVFLFFIVTFPFTTSQIGEAIALRFNPPVILYCVNILCCAVSNFMLIWYTFIRNPGLMQIWTKH